MRDAWKNGPSGVAGNKNKIPSIHPLVGQSWRIKA